MEGGYVKWCRRRLPQLNAALTRLIILPNLVQSVLFDDGLKGGIDISCLSDRSYAEDWNCPDGFTSVKLEAGVPVWDDEELSPSYLKGLLEKTLSEQKVLPFALED